MGIAVSDWVLARAVSQLGQLGVVSGTAINSVLVRRLQDGDPGGHMRRALAHFPNAEIAQKIKELYFVEGGRAPGAPYKRAPLYTIQSSNLLLQLTVVACFAEVFLAKEGHSGKVGLNLLEKIQIPNLACLYGGLLADVDYVIMGAGIPREIPGALDLLSQHLPAKLKVPVTGASEGLETYTMFDPEAVMNGKMSKPLKRPFFFPIVASSALATNLKKKSTGEVNGFIVESPLAGGHNAPPRGPMKLSETGEPIYGPRDWVEPADMKELGLPFWYAGSYATPEKLRRVLEAGGNGIQVGTLFAFCRESGIDPVLRQTVVERILSGNRDGWIYTDPRSSPTGFPFKAVQLPGSMSEAEVYEKRRRICDLGYLRHAYQAADGKVGLRCSAEPVADYVKKGGDVEDTLGRKCLCNALMADIGMGQIQTWGDKELPLLTAGDDLNQLTRILNGKSSYGAEDVLHYILSEETLAEAGAFATADAEPIVETEAPL
jgi:NAD(P)H-dependent flavin oxidoreductase YrpB (nitropropane dioxygenase family)